MYSIYLVAENICRVGAQETKSSVTNKLCSFLMSYENGKFALFFLYFANTYRPNLSYSNKHRLKVMTERTENK